MINCGGILGLIHYLDDFLIAAVDEDTCRRYMQSFNDLCERLGIPIAIEKTCGPTQILIYLGIEIDVPPHIIRLSDEKLADLITLLNAWEHKSKCTKRELQSLIGSLSFACKVIKPGRIFLRRLIDLSCTVRMPSHHIHVNAEARADIQWWRRFAKEWNGQSFFQTPIVTSPAISLFTDASDLGLGGVYGDRWFSEAWPPYISPQGTDINTREFAAIVAAVLAWGHLWTNQQILIFTDNEPITDIWSKGTCPNKDIMRLVRGLFFFCAKQNLNILFQHIPGHTNVLPDLLSRLKVQSFKRLHPTAHQHATKVPDETWRMLIG